MDFLEELVPHRICLMGRQTLIFWYALSNSITALSYFGISSSLFLAAWKKKTLDCWWLVIAFGAFILSCGIGHVFMVVNIYTGFYVAETWVHVATAILSMGTCIVSPFVFKRIMAIPTKKEKEILLDKLADRAQVLNLLISKGEKDECLFLEAKR